MRFCFVLAVLGFSACGGAPPVVTWPHGSPSAQCFDDATIAWSTDSASRGESFADHLQSARTANELIACEATSGTQSELSITSIQQRRTCLRESADAAQVAATQAQLVEAEALWSQCANAAARLCNSSQTVDVAQSGESSYRTNESAADGDEVEGGEVEENEASALRSMIYIFINAYRRIYELTQAPADRESLLVQLGLLLRRVNDEPRGLVLAVELARIASSRENRREAVTFAQIEALQLQRNALSESDDPHSDPCATLYIDTIDELSRAIACGQSTDETTVSLCGELRRARADAN